MTSSAKHCLVFFLTIVFCNCENGSFPNKFLFGIASSSYQIEGGWDADGKGPNIWDYITHNIPYYIKDGSNGDVACDSYHKWQDDVEMLKSLGVHSYRFSISWTRILPDGFVNRINPAGVEYYNNLINKLLENRIEPVVTLHHWETPQTLLPLGDLSNPLWVTWFYEYAKVIFRLFGDRVNTWVTYNEPKLLCVDYPTIGGNGTYWPNGIFEYICTKNLLKSHAEVYHLYHTELKLKGRVGISVNVEWPAPASNNIKDIEAAEQARQFQVGLFLNPLLNYDYPKIVIDRIANRSKLEGFPTSRLPTLSDAEKSRISKSSDFIGINYYSSWLVQASPEAPIVGKPSFAKDMGTYQFKNQSWPGTDQKVVPMGLRSSLQWLKATYGNPEILITETGYMDKTGTLNDYDRITFLKLHLQVTLQAIYEDNINVTTFMVWSLMDAFEWSSGYQVKFGLFHVDFNSANRTRTPKKSVEFFKDVIKNNRVQ